MISRLKALRLILSLSKRMPHENVSILNSLGRILSKDLFSKCTQPPCDISAMDGYAINKKDKVSGKILKVIGESSAGKSFNGSLKLGEAVKIFTGGILPLGSNSVVIKENVVEEGRFIKLSMKIDRNDFVRNRGFDFSVGDLLSAPLKLGPAQISLVAAMNYSVIPVFKKPKIALISTGNELVPPGFNLTKNHVVASNSYGLNAMLKSFGANPKVLPIAKDNINDLQEKLKIAVKYDLILTIGGVSGGDYDLVKESAEKIGFKLKFHKVAMRPGKPLLAGSLEGKPLIGLPGNPVSSLICCHIMVKPLIFQMLGLKEVEKLSCFPAKTLKALPKNGEREHFMRAKLKTSKNELLVNPLNKQDSSLLSELNKANALIIRSPNAVEVKKFDYVHVVPFFLDLN